MNYEFKVLEISADDYPPTNISRIRPMKIGDVLWVNVDSKTLNLKVGDVYPKYDGRFRVIKVWTNLTYGEKHWWQFWKKTIPMSYMLEYIKED